MRKGEIRSNQMDISEMRKGEIRSNQMDISEMRKGEITIGRKWQNILDIFL